MDELEARRILKLAQDKQAEKAKEKKLNQNFDLKEWLKAMVKVAGELVPRTHPKQYAFLTDIAKFVVAVTSRQSGKTKGIAKSLVIEPIAYRNPTGESAVFAYISLTKASARSIIWNDVLNAIKDENLKDYVKKIDNARNEITYKNGNVFRIFGMKDINDIERLRGLRIRGAYIDEAQSAKDRLLKYLIEEVLMMALIANDGYIKMTGTPNAECAGYFYNASQNFDPILKKELGWKVHNWNIFDNIFIKNAKAFLEESYRLRGIDENDPAYKREALGLWIPSFDSQMYRFKPSINSHDFQSYEVEYILKDGLLLETEKRDKKGNLVQVAERKDFVFKSTRYLLPKRKEWFYVLGMDYGFGDDCAWVVFAFNAEDNCVYIVETINHAGLIPSVAADLTYQLWEHYQFYKIVADSGGAGKSYIEEAKARYNKLNITPAKKTEKSAYIKLMNDDFAMAKIKADPNSDIVQEWRRNVWAVIGVKEKDGQDNHLSDAGLYGWRECRHYAYFEKKEEAPKAGTDEYYKKVEEDLEEQDDENYERSSRGGKSWWEDE